MFHITEQEMSQMMNLKTVLNKHMHLRNLATLKQKHYKKHLPAQSVLTVKNSVGEATSVWFLKRA